MPTYRTFNCKSGARGFSLLELIMVMVVLGISAAVAAPFLSASFQSYFTGKDIGETDWQARVALERMSRELRNVRAPDATGPYLIITSAGDITFTDIDGNSTRYCMGGVGGCLGAVGELTRNSQPLATGISALTFSFLTKTGAVTAVAANIFYITVAFTATQNTINKSFQATVSPRNFP